MNGDGAFCFVSEKEEKISEEQRQQPCSMAADMGKRVVPRGVSVPCTENVQGFFKFTETEEERG